MPFLKNPIPDFGFEHTLHFLPCIFEFPPPPPQGSAVRSLVPKQQRVVTPAPNLDAAGGMDAVAFRDWTEMLPP